jgi:hypothetical protein
MPSDLVRGAYFCEKGGPGGFPLAVLMTRAVQPASGQQTGTRIPAFTVAPQLQIINHRDCFSPFAGI